MLAAGLLPGSTSVAQETGCTLPSNPGGAITFGLEPPEYDVGTQMGWGLEFDQPAESGYASEPVFELDGPSGHQTVTLPFTVPGEGTYTVTAHWTESCGDGVTPDRTVTSRPGTFTGVGPQPPSGGGELRQGGGRLPGGRREPAAALLHVGCPNNRIDEPLRVVAHIDRQREHGVAPHPHRGPPAGGRPRRRPPQPEHPSPRLPRLQAQPQLEPAREALADERR